ncbi:MAG: hypothetical protein V4527_18875 [Pseudomonadota bacterium]
MKRPFMVGDAVAALCIWEAMLDQRDKIPALAEAFDRHGSYSMRDTAIELAADVEDIWARLNTDDALLDGVSFDWEYIPALMPLVDWPGASWAVPMATIDRVVMGLADELALGMAGYKITETGGGANAWRLDRGPLYVLITGEDGASASRSIDRDEQWLVGLHSRADDDNNDIASALCKDIKSALAAADALLSGNPLPEPAAEPEPEAPKSPDDAALSRIEQALQAWLTDCTNVFEEEPLVDQARTLLIERLQSLPAALRPMVRVRVAGMFAGDKP